MKDNYLGRIGTLIRDARRHQGLTQNDLADSLGTSQSAVARIEQGKQNLSLDMLARIGQSLDSEFVSMGHSGPQHLRIVGFKICTYCLIDSNCHFEICCARCVINTLIQ